MIAKKSSWLALTFLLSLAIGGCQAQQPKRNPAAAPGDWTLPYGKWMFAFFTPETLPAWATHVRIVDTAGYVYQFNTLDGTQSNPASVGSWSNKVRRNSIHWNKVNYPPQHMIFCWDSAIDLKVYETSLFFPPEVWQRMMTPSDHKANSGRTVWYDTMLFGLAPGGNVKVWLQDVGQYPNYPVPVKKLKTVSGDQLNVCKGITESNFSRGYDQDVKDFIKGKTYPYGNW